MELITPHIEIWEQGNTLEDMWKHIARCTRVCYQSIPKENGETEEEFVKRVILRGTSNGDLDWDKVHSAMLEHGTVYLRFYDYKFDRNPGLKYVDNKYSKTYYSHNYGIWYVTTNLRVIFENGWQDDLKYICNPTEYHIRRVTVSFTTNIGVTREFNRHRVNSMAEESTRYCNYSKNRQIKTSNNTLGSSSIVNDVAPVNGHIRYGLPYWLLNEENLPYIESHQFDKLSSYCEDVLANDNIIDNWCDMDYYLFSLTVAEFCYNSLIVKGWKPQQAREVLPLATKSQLIHTAFVDDWKHFFALRADAVSGPPHPNAKLLAEPLKKEFIKRGYIK